MQSTSISTTYWRIALPVPLRRLFDYLPPTTLTDAAHSSRWVGCRVRVSFGHRQLVGIVYAITDHSDHPAETLKAVQELLDEQPCLPSTQLALTQWAAQYYHHPIGDALMHALPTRLRKGEQAQCSQARYLTLTPLGEQLDSAQLQRAPKQLALWQRLRQQGKVELSSDDSATARALIDKQFATLDSRDQLPVTERATPPAQLTEAQQRVLDQSQEWSEGFSTHLLEGVTGSGKTEIYLALIRQQLARGRQVLMLLPEIGLTPQMLRRIRQGLGVPVGVIHSGLSERQRCDHWLLSQSGQLPVLLGTRSAVFTPMPKLGLIIIDEEHDSSYKQQDGFRYHARNLAIKRAQLAGVPIWLGSATPCLETLHAACSGRFHYHRLAQPAIAQALPRQQLIDTQELPPQVCISPSVLSQIRQTLQRGEQAMVFLNRRGYAPSLLCNSCGWSAQCRHCDARLVVHLEQRKLRCHHCDSQWPLPHQCPQCHSQQLHPLGQGTQRIEAWLHEQLGEQAVIWRIDRDNDNQTHRQQWQSAVAEGQPAVLVGTQMLAKGHDYPNLTLVVVLDVDAGLFSADFRAPELLAQLLVQVSGRAGRGQRPGQVLIQTRYPEHPLLQQLLRDGYPQVAQQLLEERSQRHLPPFGHLALVRADARHLEQAERFLQQLKRHGGRVAEVSLIGPLPAPMSRRAGLYRAHLLLQSTSRPALHRQLRQLIHAADTQRSGPVSWSIDVDPLELNH